MAHRQPRNFMIDTETVGLRPTSIFWQVAVVEFNIYPNGDIVTPGNSFTTYACPAQARAMVENKEATFDESTVEWLLEQPAIAETFKVWWDCFNKSERLPEHYFALTYPEIISSMTNVMGGAAKPDVQVWAKGADFDFPIIVNTVRAFGLTEPWHYRNKNCMRTWQNEALRLGMEIPKPDNNHDAFSDCINQIGLLEKVRKFCMNGYRGA